MSEVHYYSNYANSRDIDCFFRIGNAAYHFASNGQPIPAFITRGKNIAIQDAVYVRVDKGNGEVEIMTDTIRALIQREMEGVHFGANEKLDERDSIERMVDDYVTSFVEMARVGFISMDMDEEGVCHIIASPKDQVPDEEIMKMLPVVEEGTISIE